MCVFLVTKYQKKHGGNSTGREPFCRFPSVYIECKELKDGMYLVTCTGDGFPSPTISVKHREVIAATSSRVKNKVIYSLTNDINVTCEVHNTVGKNGSHQIEIEDKTKSNFSLLSVVYYTTMFISCAFTICALLFSLFIFNSYFKNVNLEVEAYFSKDM